MKKLILINLFLLSMSLIGSMAQQVPVGYFKFEFTEGSGSYTELSSATVLSSADNILGAFKNYAFVGESETVVSLDDLEEAGTNIKGIPMGFSIADWGGVNTFLPISNGYVMFGKDNIDVNNIQTNSDLGNMAIGLCADVSVQRSEDTKVSYSITGDAGSKVLAIEYKNLRYNYDKETKQSKDSITYTIKIYENGSYFEIYFGNMYAFNSGTWFRVGMRGLEYEDRHYRQPKEKSWNDTKLVVGASGASNFSDATITVGSTYKFSFPDDCKKPTTKPAIVFNNYLTTGIDVEVTLPENEDGDGFLVVYSKEQLNQLPANGTMYEEYDEFGNGTVLFASNERPDNDGDRKTKIRKLEGNTKYYVYGWMLNSHCKGELIYGDSCMYTFTTKTLAPKSLNMEYANNEITLSPEANALGEEILIATTTVMGKDEANNDLTSGLFGLIEGNLKVGDTLFTATKEFGGEIIYIGAVPEEPIKYTKLKDNTFCHFGAFSKGANSVYSSDFANADVLTDGVVPFTENFVGKFPKFVVPFGWGGSESFRIERAGSLDGTIMPSDPEKMVYIETPPITFPSEKDVRLVFSYNIHQFINRGKVPLTASGWDENDSIIVSVKKVGGEYTKIYAITKRTADDFTSTADYLPRYINIPGFRGQKCNVKIEYKMIKVPGNTYLSLEYINIIERPDCDAPQSVSIIESSIFADKATIAIKSMGDEQKWEISYKTPNTALSQAQEVTSNPAQITGLPSRDSIMLEVKAVCESGKKSLATESNWFISSYQTPFLEVFSDKFPNHGGGFRPLFGIPYGFSASTSPLSEGETKVQKLYGKETYEIVNIVDKVTNSAYNPIVPNADGCISMPNNTRVTMNESWLMFPAINIDETTVLNFDLYMRKYKDGDYSAPTEVSDNATLKVFVSAKDTVFSSNDLVLTLDKAAILAAGAAKNISVALENKKGKVYVAFYYQMKLEEENENAELFNFAYIDNIQVAVPCGEVKDLKVSNIHETTVDVSWLPYPKVENYTIEVLKDGETTPKYHAVSDNKYTVEDLELATKYSLSVYYVCGEDDTSAIAKAVFTTAGVSCDVVPSNLVAEDITKNSALLKWDGESESYKIKMRIKTMPEYSYMKSEAKSLAVTGLVMGKEYEFAVQSVCGQGVSDTSQWSQFVSFTTSEATCFAPSEVELTPGFNSVDLNITGDADKYQIAYRKGVTGTTNPWTTVIASSKKYTLKGLEPKSDYQIRLRSICAVGDTSGYGEIKAFLTLDIPSCPTVTNLKTADITKESANLSWTGNESHNAYLLRFREATATSWDTVKDITKESYALTSLKQKTAYIWTINASCNTGIMSGWSEQVNFETEDVATEDELLSSFNVYTSNGYIHIINTASILVEKVKIISTSGQNIVTHTVRTTENLSIPLQLKSAPVLVVVQTGLGTASYKVLIP